jgi:NTE family protein
VPPVQRAGIDITMAATTDDQEHLLPRLLAQAFGELDADATASLLDQLEPLALPGGRTLMAQGDAGDAMYIVVRGRLRAYVRDGDGAPRLVREMSRGEIIGEMSLITDEPRSATIVAVRDSQLVRLDKARFLQLATFHAPVALAITRQIIARLRTEHRTPPLAAPVTVGLVPASAGVDAPALARELAQQLRRHGRVAVLDSTSQTLPAGGVDDGAVQRAFARLLDAQEAAHAFVLLVADPTPSTWTALCTRHSDELLLLAEAAQSPAVHPTEQALLSPGSGATEAAQILVLLHDADLRSPQGTAAWLARRPVTDHVHVRPALERDMARLARLIARQAVGLVFGGGGARGFAHLGVLRALHERGIEVDCVGGTSIGAVMALLAATDRPLDEVMPIVRSGLTHNPTGDFNLIPLVSLFAGRRARRVLVAGVRALCGHDAASEDLWKNFYCVATNFSKAQEVVLRAGSCVDAVMASMAIPGALPPVVRDGDLLCDGGTFNNFPVDVMRAQRGIGCVIGVDLSARRARRIGFAAVPGPWTLVLDRLRPRKARRYKMPSLTSILLNATILYSESRQQQSAQLTDILLRPPLANVGLLQWNRMKVIEQQGYEHAIEVLDARAAVAVAAPVSAPRVAGTAPAAPEVSLS